MDEVVPQDARLPAPSVPMLPHPGTTPIHRGPVARLVSAMVMRDLRQAFARVEWVGAWPEVPPERPVGMLATHHTFFDGYAGHLVARRVFGRRVLTWMQQWEPFPFFTALGALPFPHDQTDGTTANGTAADAARERAATLRRTVRLMQSPAWALLYFPEGVLHPADDGIAPFAAGPLLARLGRIVPPTTWLPLALHAVFEDDARPVLRIAAGAPRDRIDGDERERLADLHDALRSRRLGPSRTLLDGAAGPATRWDFRALAPVFRRWL